MDQVGKMYLSLALNLDRHVEGFVDAYFGPPALRETIQKKEPRSLPALTDDARQLRDAIGSSIDDAQRRDFLDKQVTAMQAVIRKLSGERLDYLEEVELCFDISPEMVDEGVFELAHGEMDRILPGDGTVAERLEAWKQKQEVAVDCALPLFELAREETRRRTRSRFRLPAEEDVSLQLVEDEPWSAYNWYLGDYHSRIDLNTDLPVRIGAAVPLLAHEAYPGHHTEHALKEYHLLRQRGRLEHAVQLLLAPECVVSEGIADSAQDMIFSDEDLSAFLCDELYPRAGLSIEMVEVQMRLARATETLRSVGCNAALLLHRDGLAADRVQRYIEQYGLRTPREAAQTMRFIGSSLFRAYIFTYTSGKRLLAPLLEGREGRKNFQRLLSEPFTPSMVRDWLAGS